jgi:hypothetical protein
LDWPSWLELVEGIKQVLIDDGVEDALGVAAAALLFTFEIREATGKNKWLARGRVRSGDHVLFACEEAGGGANRKVQTSLLSYALTYHREQARGGGGPE